MQNYIKSLRSFLSGKNINHATAPDMGINGL